MTNLDQNMRACIEACLDCYKTCLSTATHHCLETGGRHTEPQHFRLMLACAEMCRASAHLMLTGSSAHRHSCSACAEICEACAADCERVGDMDACVEACRTCARQCREMAA